MDDNDQDPTGYAADRSRGLLREQRGKWAHYMLMPAALAAAAITPTSADAG